MQNLRLDWDLVRNSFGGTTHNFGGGSKLPWNMDDDDLEAIRAVDKFRQEKRRTPSITDILSVLKSLGWKK